MSREGIGPAPPGAPALAPWLSNLLKPIMPPILVSNYDNHPPITVRYIQGDNDLDFHAAYKSIKTLANHPGRGMLVKPSGPGPVTSKLSHELNRVAMMCLLL